jgi:hypothetical protein
VFTQVTIDSQGNPHFRHNAYKTDGKDYPAYGDDNLLAALTGTRPGTTSVKVMDAYTVVVTAKDGKGVAGPSGTSTVSRDGKTLTQGNVVLDRQ